MDKKNQAGQRPQSTPKKQPEHKPGQASPRNPNQKKEQF